MIINSLLDQDTYSLTMGQAIAHYYPEIQVKYEFFNRGNTKFPENFGHQLQQEVNAMSKLRLQNDEERFLRKTCYFLKPNYIDMFCGYHYNSTQVKIHQIEHNVNVTIEGPWYQTVYWEVPLLALISELYYQMTGKIPIESANNDWRNVLNDKLNELTDAECIVSDFGTRRRASYKVHDYVVSKIKHFKSCPGTSNLHFAHKYGIIPIGTMAHQWISGHACIFGYRQATAKMLENWIGVYRGKLGIALPDTFTTKIFLRDFDTLYAKLFDGVRHDSGNPKWFTDIIIEHYKKLRIDPRTKVIVYSDGLNTEQAIEIQKYAKNKIMARFGIGTFLTNDVGHKPLNMVIKLTKCDGRDAVKLSDSPGKETGLPEEIAICKRIFS